MLEVSNLTRYYGDFAALEDVSFHVDPGRVIGLLGLNGAGKSTTLKCLAGLLAPSAGTVKIDGVDIVEAPDTLRAKIGFLPEDPPLYDEMNVVEFLRHVGRLKGMTHAEVDKNLPRVIEMTQLGGREDQTIGTLSHGFRKRVGIAQTVIHDPKLVILDEPISGLDPAQIVEMRKVIRGLAEERVVLISSHNLTEISQTCDRILVLQEGKLLAEGSESELAKRSEGTRVVLRVRADWDRLQMFLASIDEVKSFGRVPEQPPFAGAVVDLNGDHRETLVKKLVEADIGLRMLEDPDDELEEIFLSLMAEQGGEA